MELVEFNASDQRNRDAVESSIWRAATQQTLDGRMRLILLDEIDGLSGSGDRGGARSIAKLIDETVHPIVMTANRSDLDKLKDIVKKCQVFSFTAATHEEVTSVLERVCSLADVSMSPDVLSAISDEANGDFRAAIADLQAVAEGTLGHLPDLRNVRDSLWSIPQMLSRLFATIDPSVARKVLSDADVDFEQTILWIEENVHHHLHQPSELAAAYEALSLADLTLGRISRHQNWKLLSYFYDFLAVGVTSSRTVTPFRRAKYKRPIWPLLVWRGRQSLDKKLTILQQLMNASRVSRYRLLHLYWHVLSFLSGHSQSLAEALRTWLGAKPDAFRRSLGGK